MVIGDVFDMKFENFVVLGVEIQVRDLIRQMV